MARVHEIGVGADTRAFEDQIKRGIIDPVQDAEKALDDLGRSRGPGQLERDLERAQQETEDLADETKRTARQIEQSYRDAGRDIKKGIGDGLNDAKSEAKQSGREAAASFSGEWTDAADFVQETMANAFGGFGPLGAAAGIAAAAGIGVVTETILSQQRAADELKARLSAAYQHAAEEGRTYLDTAQIIAEASDLMFNKDRAAEWKQVQEDAKQLGLDVYDVVAANAGETDKQREVQERINALVDEAKSKYEENDSVVGNLGQSVLGLENRWRDVIAATEEEKAKAEELAGVVAKSEEQNREQIDRTARAAQERYEGLAALYGKPIKATLEVEASGLDAAERRLQILHNRAAEGITVITRAGEGRFWE